MELQTLQLQRADGIATITLNRPQQGNAISMLMVRELEQLCRRLDDEATDRVVVFRGAGETFCSGIDLLDFPPDEKPDVRGFSRWERACRTIERLPMVTIAAIDGECAGGGMQLALTCDARVATDRSFYHLHEVRDGFLPGMGTFRLAKFIGLGRARFFGMTGRRMNAEEAETLGVIDCLCAASDLDISVETTIAAFGAIHSDAIELVRRLFDESFEIAYEDFLGCFLAAQNRAIQTDAFKTLVARAHELGKTRP
ncbi:MAG: enoyl-CoA hydratase/isomerase family protein [Thermoanaerobaculales bacterium]|nr:enoyl-CoA hydratase/isomerase family protein [Thermoanaerobaculales bacterium]